MPVACTCPDCFHVYIVPDSLEGSMPCPKCEAWSASAVALPIIRAVVWTMFLAWSLFVMIWYFRTGERVNVPAAVDGCFWLILAYGVARAIDSMTRWRN